MADLNDLQRRLHKNYFEDDFDADMVVFKTLLLVYNAKSVQYLF